MKNISKVYVVKKTSMCGWEHEGQFRTKKEAEMEIDAMMDSAIREDDERRKWLAAHPQPWNEQDKHTAWVNGYDCKETPIDRFNSMGWYIDCQPASCYVTRLNTLPAESEKMMKEIEFKVDGFGRCILDWSCTGHTRAYWQSEAACAQLKKLHPEWKVEVESLGYRARVLIDANAVKV